MSQRLSANLYRGLGPWRIILDVVIQIVLLCGSKDPVFLHPGR